MVIILLWSVRNRSVTNTTQSSGKIFLGASEFNTPLYVMYRITSSGKSIRAWGDYRLIKAVHAPKCGRTINLWEVTHSL